MTRIEESIEVNVPLHTAYNQWTQFEEFPRFMEGVMEVRQLDEAHLHWRARRHEQEVEWTSEIVDQKPDQCIAWRDTGGPGNFGKVSFQPVRDGRTRIIMVLESAHAGAPDNPEATVRQRIRQDLERFKMLIETQGVESGAWRGEIRDAHPVHGASPDRNSPEAAGGSAGGSAAGEPAGEGTASSATHPHVARAHHDRRHGGIYWLPHALQNWEEPISVMRRMTQEVDSLLERFIGRPLGAMAGAWMPPVEVCRRDNRLVVCAELPGVKKEDVQVEVTRDKLVIEGERRHESETSLSDDFRRSERSYGHFHRVVPLPEGVDPDAAEAALHDGVLEVSFPLPQPGRQGRRLDIQAPR